MRRLTRRRLAGQAPDAGVYAILYAVLVVVLLGMGAVVVDFASVRSDRRVTRSATDSAVLGAAQFLNPQGTGGASPYTACQTAWDYLVTTLHLSSNPGRLAGANACTPFLPASLGMSVAAYCAQASPTEVDANWPLGNRTYRIAWPIPTTGGSGFLNPDIAPGTVSQTYAPGIDGPSPAPSGSPSVADNGCDRIGAAVFENAKLPLGSGVGISSTSTQVHSVARLDATGGPAEMVAALNVLNPHLCESLVTTGNGKVLVGPVLRNGEVKGPGTIAVEADGLNPNNGNVSSSCNGGKYVIDPTTGQGSLICASNTILVNASSCDGLGIIQSHAIDPGAALANACNTTYTNCNNLLPVKLTPEGTTHSWLPVTKLYGCNTSRLPCTPPATNYIAALESAYGGPGMPANVYSGSQAPYVEQYPVSLYPFTAVPATACGNVSGLQVLPAGNWYANCTITVKSGGTLIVQGGNLVVTGKINVSSGGCFVVNTAVSTCPTTVSGSGAAATTNTPPLSDAIVFLRGGSLQNNGALVMPQTFAYSMGSPGGGVSVNGTTLTLWTAPGAGPEIGSGRTRLEQACYDSAKEEVNQNCLDSRFSRLDYWSDYAAPQSPASSSNTFNGQGNLNVVGVFFTPEGYFNFTGGGSYAAAAAQFWADQLNVNGGAVIGLSPDSRFAVSNPTALIRLIR